VISEGTLGFPSGIEPLFVILEKEKRWKQVVRNRQRVSNI
jgi:hypothetical protein